MGESTEQVRRLVELARIPVSILPIASIDPDPEQPRRPGRDVSGLAANMERAGQLQPVAVVSAEDGRYRLVFGEGRWLAARSLEWAEIAAQILDGLSEAEITAIQLAENVQRDALTEAEIANGTQRVLDLGGAVELAANAAGVQTEVVERARAAREKIGSAAPATLTLEQYGALDEFADDKKAVAALEKAATEGQFAYKLADLRHRRVVAGRKAEAKAALEADGVPIVKYDYMGPNKPLAWIGVNPAEHVSCPGHAAWIDREGIATYVCTQPHLHGHGSSPEAEAEKEAEAARRAEADAVRNEQYGISTPLRVEWLAGYVAAGKFDPKSLGMLYAEVWANGLTAADEYSMQQQVAALVGKRPRKEQRFVAQVFAQYERDLHHALDRIWQVREDTLQHALDYFGLLRAVGYKPNEGDTALRDALAARLAERNEKAA